MTLSPRQVCNLRIELPATLPAMEEFSMEFRRWSQVLLGRSNCFAAELLMREALTNAVVHGCHTDPDRRVRCCVRLREHRLVIAVAHDGEGFDWRVALGNSAHFEDCSGRGIEILRTYANRVRYNERGNVVTMIKRF